MRTISFRLDDTIQHLLQVEARQSVRPTPAELAGQFGLIGAFRSTEGDLGERHAAHLNACVRARHEQDSVLDHSAGDVGAPT
jgi:hypothetical protein